MADFSKIGRNNKNRGRAFERSVAEKLGWSRVPYSGAIKEWGGADVVDGFYTRNGLWAAECKTQQPGARGSISIKHKWIEQMIGGEAGGRQGIIITKNVRSPRALVVMQEDTFLWMTDGASTGVERQHEWTKLEHSTFTRGNGLNFVIEPDIIDSATSGGLAVRLEVTDKFNRESIWYVISLDKFAAHIKKHNLYIPEQKPDANA